MKDRIREEGVVFRENSIEQNYLSDKEIDNLIDNLQIVDIWGSPESSIVLMVRKYFLLKK